MRIHPAASRRSASFVATFIAGGSIGLVLAGALPSAPTAMAQVSTDNPVVAKPARDSELLMVAVPGGRFDQIRSNRSMGEAEIRRLLRQGYVTLGITGERVYMAKK